MLTKYILPSLIVGALSTTVFYPADAQAMNKQISGSTINTERHHALIPMSAFFNESLIRGC